MKKIVNKRVFIMCISFIALGISFCSCEPEDEPSNPSDNEVYYKLQNSGQSVQLDNDVKY